MKFDSMYVDAALYMGIAFFTALTGALATDEAAKFIVPPLLWYIRTAATTLLATTAALKMFRSQAFSDYLKKNGNGKTVEPPKAQTP